MNSNSLRFESTLSDVDSSEMAPEDTAEIKNTLEQHEKRLVRLENLLESKPKEYRKELSIGEFMLAKKAESDVDKVLVMGYYLEHYRDTTSFNVEDLEKGFREAKETFPANINLAVIGNIKKGRIMEDKEKKDKKKAWILTGSGTQFVENELGKSKRQT
jgi:hypothetical protein